MEKETSKQMKTPFQERLSTFTDDELGDFEARRMVHELLESPELREKWTRYQVIGSILRKEPIEALDPAFTETVMERIEKQPAYVVAQSQKQAKRATHWFKPFVGVAIAASVAALSLLFVSRYLVPVAPEPAGPSLTLQEPTVAPGASAESAVAQSEVTEADKSTEVTPVSSPTPAQMGTMASATSQRAAVFLDDTVLNSFLASHAEFAAHMGFLPQVRIVGFDSDAQ